jgi:hypothetical protein
MKLYVASSWKNNYYDALIRYLVRHGYEVYDFKADAAAFNWRDLDPDWQNWTPERFREVLKTPEAQRGFLADSNAMEWAEAGLLVLPAGRSAHLEAGWLMGRDKPVIIYAPNPICDACQHKSWDFTPELMYLLSALGTEALCVTLGEVRERLDRCRNEKKL